MDLPVSYRRPVSMMHPRERPDHDLAAQAPTRGHRWGLRRRSWKLLSHTRGSATGRVTSPRRLSSCPELVTTSSYQAMLSRMSYETTTSADAWPLTGDGIDWAVAINVGSGPGGSAARQASMARWADDARRARQPAIVFAQEVTSGWVDGWRHEGY